MILKFIRSKDYSPKCEYFNVPDNSIIHRTRSHDDGLEDWIIVVDSEYYLCVREGVLVSQIYREKCCLPVVAVDDVRLEAQMRKRIDDRTAEEAEALVLVAAHAIDVGTAEVELIVHEVPLHAILLDHLDAAVLTAPAQLYRKLCHRLGDELGIFLDLVVVRKDQDHFVAGDPSQCCRQSLHHVAQAAGLGIGRAFGSKNGDSHTISPLEMIMG